MWVSSEPIQNEMKYSFILINGVKNVSCVLIQCSHLIIEVKRNIKPSIQTSCLETGFIHFKSVCVNFNFVTINLTLNP